ncbi:leucine-rich repeat domain-containing protein [candidate division KSB1 bacterium]
MKAFAKHLYCSSIALFFILIISSCERSVESGSEIPIARLGGDQTVKVGQYVTLDGSASTAGWGDTIVEWEWEQNESNPHEVYFFHHGEDYVKEVGFNTEGIYHLSLRVTSSNGLKSEPATIAITVLPRDIVLFEDADLEICVRRYLDMPVEDLNEGILNGMDSLLIGFTPNSGKVESFAGMEHCVNLEYFWGGHQRVVDLSPLTNLTNMKDLSLTQHWTIIDISPLASMTEMRELWLDQNIITDISSLASMTKLEYLRLDFNPVTDIAILSNLTELREVYFIGAPFADISVISELLKLEVFWAMDCNIQDISPLANLTKLKFIHLELNNISDISALRNSVLLERLYISDNRIKDISVIKYLINIEILRLRNNQIEDILPLVENTGIGNGDAVLLSGNPLNEQSVNVYIPALQDRGVNVSY